MKQYKSVILSIILLLTTLGANCSVMAAANNNSNTAVYRVTFLPTFTAASHPYRYIARGTKTLHFTPLIVGTYKKGYEMYQLGTKVTLGLKLMAEKGKISTLRREMSKAKRAGLVYSIASYNHNSYDQIVTLYIKMVKSFPFVAATTMIGPSPDWFAGVADVKLYDGHWLPSKTVISYAYDSGTDAGTDYTSANKVQVPTKNVDYVRTHHFVHKNKFNPVAVVIFTRVS